MGDGKFEGPADLGRRGRSAGRCLGAGVLAAGPPRGVGRSHGGLAVRMKAAPGERRDARLIRGVDSPAYPQSSSIGPYRSSPEKGTYSKPRPNESSRRTVVQSMPIAE